MRGAGGLGPTRRCAQAGSGPADDFAGWLAHADAQHAQTIDMGLERVAAVRDVLALALDFPLITVAGTNGKGSTCAMLAAMLQAAGHVVGIYMDSLATYGSGFYRNLFWEAGMVGQMLYLEAEESGIRATGIDCYFDDPVHAAFGVFGVRAQIRRAYGSPEGRGAMHRSEIGV